MPEQKQEVKVYSIEYTCDDCKEGHMKPTGVCLPSNPPQYPHKCEKCGSEKTFFTTYPRTEYGPADDLQRRKEQAYRDLDYKNPK